MQKWSDHIGFMGGIAAVIAVGAAAYGLTRLGGPWLAIVIGVVIVLGVVGGIVGSLEVRPWRPNR